MTFDNEQDKYGYLPITRLYRLKSREDDRRRFSCSGWIHLIEMCYERSVDIDTLTEMYAYYVNKDKPDIADEANTLKEDMIEAQNRDYGEVLTRRKASGSEADTPPTQDIW